MLKCTFLVSIDTSLSDLITFTSCVNCQTCQTGHTTFEHRVLQHSCNAKKNGRNTQNAPKRMFSRHQR